MSARPREESVQAALSGRDPALAPESAREGSAPFPTSGRDPALAPDSAGAATELVEPAALHAFVRDVLRAVGCPPQEAEVTAEAMTWCDRVGRETQGTWRLPNLVERIERRVVRSPAPLRIDRSRAVRVVDGGDGIGYWVASVALDEALTAARANGVGAAAVRNSNHLGALAWYLERAARRGMATLACSNSFPKVAPHGGVDPLLGTNPFGFGCPRANGRSLLVDFSTGPRAGSDDRRARERAGESAPPLDVVMTADGAKGFALGLVVEVLAGVLSGAGISREVGSQYAEWTHGANVGHFFVALDVERFLPHDNFLQRLELLLGAVERSRPAPGGQPVRVPGSARWEHATSERSALAGDVARTLAELGRARGVPAPWA